MILVDSSKYGSRFCSVSTFGSVKHFRGKEGEIPPHTSKRQDRRRVIWGDIAAAVADTAVLTNKFSPLEKVLVDNGMMTTSYEPPRKSR